MEMHQVRYFLAVCETLNFTRAAESCHVAQPALSRAIRNLEHELGGLLFHRAGGQVRLTDLGRLVQPHLERIVAERESAITTAHSFLKLENAALDLGVMCTIGPIRFSGFLARFQREAPDIALSVREGVPGALLDLLDRGEIAAAVLAQPDPFDGRFSVTPLYRERFMAAFPSGHRCAKLKAVRLEDLANESYLSRMNCEFRDAIRAQREARDVPIRYAFRSEREDWIQSLVAAGLGFTIIPEFSALHAGIVVRPMTAPEFVREVSLVLPKAMPVAPPLGRFVEAIRAYLWNAIDGVRANKP